MPCRNYPTSFIRDRTALHSIIENPNETHLETDSAFWELPAGIVEDTPTPDEIAFFQARSQRYEIIRPRQTITFQRSTLDTCWPTFGNPVQSPPLSRQSSSEEPCGSGGVADLTNAFNKCTMSTSSGQRNVSPQSTNDMCPLQQCWRKEASERRERRRS